MNHLTLRRSSQMKVWFKKISFVFLCFFIAISSAEFILEYQQSVHEKKENTQVEPFYPLSINTTKGERIRGAGYMKLVVHPFMLFKNLPNQKTPYFAINSLGFRGTEINNSLTHGKKRIIVVGGSVAFGTGLKRDEETFPVQLEQILENAEVINAAVPGYLSSQELIYVVTELIDLKPNLIIALDGFNDFNHPRNISGEFDQMEEALRVSLIPSNLILRLKKVFNLFYPEINKRIDRIRKKGIQKTTDILITSKDNLAEDSNFYSIQSSYYSANIIKMARFLDSLNCRFLCVFSAFNGRNKEGNEKIFIEQYALFRKEVKSRFDENKILYLDLNDYQFTNDKFFDVVHLNASGNLEVAKIVSDAIKKSSLLDHDS